MIHTFANLTKLDGTQAIVNMTNVSEITAPGVLPTTLYFNSATGLSGLSLQVKEKVNDIIGSLNR